MFVDGEGDTGAGVTAAGFVLEAGGRVPFLDRVAVTFGDDTDLTDHPLVQAEFFGDLPVGKTALSFRGRQEDWSVTGAVIATEAVSRCGPVGIAFGLTAYGGTHQILAHGTEEQKQKWLPRIARGELRGSITMTEPYAGSDIAAVETTAVRNGDHYVVNGIKRFQTGAGSGEEPVGRRAARLAGGDAAGQ